MRHKTPPWWAVRRREKRAHEEAIFLPVMTRLSIAHGSLTTKSQRIATFSHLCPRKGEVACGRGHYSCPRVVFQNMQTNNAGALLPVRKPVSRARSFVLEPKSPPGRRAVILVSHLRREGTTTARPQHQHRTLSGNMLRKIPMYWSGLSLFDDLQKNWLQSVT